VCGGGIAVAAAVMCVVAVLLLLLLLLLLPRVMIAMMERTAYCVRSGKVPPHLGTESRLADWAVFTELFVSLSKRMLELFFERATEVPLPHHSHFILQFNALKSVRLRWCL